MNSLSSTNPLPNLPLPKDNTPVPTEKLEKLIIKICQVTSQNINESYGQTSISFESFKKANKDLLTVALKGTHVNALEHKGKLAEINRIHNELDGIVYNDNCQRRARDASELAELMSECSLEEKLDRNVQKLQTDYHNHQ